MSLTQNSLPLPKPSLFPLFDLPPTRGRRLSLLSPRPHPPAAWAYLPLLHSPLACALPMDAGVVRATPSHSAPPCSLATMSPHYSTRLPPSEQFPETPSPQTHSAPPCCLTTMSRPCRPACPERALHSRRYTHTPTPHRTRMDTVSNTHHHAAPALLSKSPWQARHTPIWPHPN
jgi:hypothetical protein